MRLGAKLPVRLGAKVPCEGVECPLPDMATPPCCPAGSLGALEQSTAGGGQQLSLDGIEEAAPLEIYATSAPASAERAVLLITDVYGAESGHHRRFCDQLAAALGPGFVVIMPDFFRGSP